MKSLRALEKRLAEYSGEASDRKVSLIREIEASRLRSRSEVLRFHEALCFLRAYPDDRRVLRAVVRALQGFSRRSDLRRFRHSLADSGIAGTDTHYRFFWFTALWLSRRAGESLFVDWASWKEPGRERLAGFLTFLLPYTETLALDELGYETKGWIDRLKGPGETDAAFLIRRFDELRAGGFVREAVFEDLDPPFRLAPGRGTPSRTLAVHPRPVVFQKEPLKTERPRLPDAVLEPHRGVWDVSRREGQRLIDLARGAMVTRQRDLDVFAHADARDVRLVDAGGGLEFACFGAIPERRLVLDAVVGFLTLKNGVPIGYVLCNVLFGSAGVAYNVFETFRGGESGYVYGRVLGMIRHLFSVDAFFIDPYQLGHENEEGQRSGAWWFYYKLGFRPEDPGVKRLLARELQRMKRNPGHRSGMKTINALASENMYYYLEGRREDMLGKIDLGAIGSAVSGMLAERFGSDRERGVRILAREAAALAELRSLAKLTRAEQLAWDRWSPVLLSVPGIHGWPRDSRRALAGIVRAKGGRREADFVPLFDAHRRLRRALAKMGS